MSLTIDVRPVETEIDEIRRLPTGVIAPDIHFKSDIPSGSFVFDYDRYVKNYESMKAKNERSEQLEQLGQLQEAADRAVGTPKEPWALEQLNQRKAELTDLWGREFDDDIINLLQTLLITHKDLTIRMRPEDELFWYDRFLDEIVGKPGDQDTWHYVEECGWVQDNPGRPDKERIKIRLCKIPLEEDMGSVAVLETRGLVEGQEKVSSPPTAA